MDSVISLVFSLQLLDICFDFYWNIANFLDILDHHATVLVVDVTYCQPYSIIYL
jgi:hypothetical protein